MPRRSFFTWLGFVPAIALFCGTPPQARAQSSHNEVQVKRLPNIQDKEGIWVLDFSFVTPRLITVDIPARGRRICWYMMYRVSNHTGEARTFIPDFELVTTDKSHVSHDQVLPKVQEAIRILEDPSGRLDLKNSVTIASQPIPPSLPNAAPIWVPGVAIWDDVSPEATRYSVFVSGLSNGWSIDDRGVIRRKTLQLNFKRLADRYYQDSRDIRFVPPFEWVYRASTLKASDTPAASPKTDAGTGLSLNSKTNKDARR